jgi:hypothetical protein
MVRVYSARNEVEAHFVRNALETEGITATVQGETLATGSVPILGESLPSVWVNDEDVDRAQVIVNALPQGEDRPAPATWTCPTCQEKIAQQFDTCWKCGTANPAAT